MKIAIVGYSGAGKSTLARDLAKKYGVEPFHFDTVQFLPGWGIRDKEEKERMTASFMDTHSGWVMDGNYTKLSYERRMEEADMIIIMAFNRFSCLLRAYKRYLTFRNNTRPDIADGCNEKFDWAFARWILWEGRSKKTRKKFHALREKYPEKCVVLKNQRQLDRFRREQGIMK